VPLTKAPKVVVTRDSVTKTNIKPTKDVLAAGVVSKPTRIKKCLVVLNEATGELVNMTKPVKTGCLMKDARRTLIKMAKVGCWHEWRARTLMLFLIDDITAEKTKIKHVPTRAQCIACK
jgi:hypothetical protein